MPDFLDRIGWSPAIGDPSAAGWMTVLAYFVCCYQSFRVYLRGERIFNPPVKRQIRLWGLIALAMLLLGINKQLDLQTFFTAAVKYFALEQGWYHERRVYQKLFIFVVSGMGLMAWTVLLATYLPVIRQHYLALFGSGALLVFVLMRASSFHTMDSFISSRFWGLKMNWVLELSGIVLILMNARHLLRKQRPLINLNTVQAPPPRGRGGP